MEEGKLGRKVVVALNNKHGIGAALLHSLHSSPSLGHPLLSNLLLPLRCNSFANGEIITFHDASGPQVSLIILQELPRPESVYAAHEVVNYVAQQAPVQAPDFMLIFVSTIAPAQSLRKGVENSQESSLHAAFFNVPLDLQKLFLEGVRDLPLDIQLGDEFLAALLHFARLSDLPTALLVLPMVKLNPLNATDQDRSSLKIQAIENLGKYLAKNLDLMFSTAMQNGELGDLSSLQSVEMDDWRKLYI